MTNSNLNISRILAIIGGIVFIVEPILSLIQHGNFGIGTVIGIIIGIIVLISTGTIQSRTNISFDGVTLIVLGVLALIFGGSTLGAILILIAAILLLI